MLRAVRAALTAAPAAADPDRSNSTVAAHALGAKILETRVAPTVGGGKMTLATLPVSMDLRKWAVTPGNQRNKAAGYKIKAFSTLFSGTNQNGTTTSLQQALAGTSGKITRDDAWYQIDGGALVSIKLASALSTTFSLTARVGHHYRIAVRATAGSNAGQLRFGADFVAERSGRISGAAATRRGATMPDHTANNAELLNDDDGLAAGDFSRWLDGMQAALRNERDSDVPCGACTACCTSSQFVHIAPDETETLSHIPAELLFPAPHMPRGHVLLGYDERGHCPMLVDDACTIYEHRPRTCRTYDCRVFPAAGVEVDADKPLIAQRTRRWRFDFPDAGDRIRYDAVHAAASFLREHGDEIPAADRPANETQLAVAALEMHETFL